MVNIPEAFEFHSCLQKQLLLLRKSCRNQCTGVVGKYAYAWEVVNSHAQELVNAHAQELVNAHTQELVNSHASKWS